MNNPLISIIIPVYNVEKYIDKCIMSVLQQTYTNIEIYLVDDGSTDKSGSICDQYAKKDSRIIVIHKENGGLSSARNAALDVIHGEYITFVDSDDFVSDNYVAFLYEILQKESADVSVCQMFEFFDETGLSDDNLHKTEIVNPMSSKEAITKFLLQKNLYASAWGKLYRKEIFEQIRYPVGYYYEDMAIIHKIFMLANRIAYSESQNYYYRQRKDGIMRQKFNSKKLHRIIVAENIKADVLKVYPELEQILNVRCFLANIQTWRELPYDSQYEQYKNQIWSGIKKYRRDALRCGQAKISTRGMALVSYCGKSVLKVAGNIYSIVLKK